MAAEAKKVAVYPKQHAFIACNPYLKAFTGGVGSGKSKAGAINLFLRSEPDCTYMVVSPSYKMLDRATFLTFQEVADDFGLWEKGCYKEVKREANLKNGAKYLFCSADDPDSLRGPNARGFWGDEMQSCKEEAFTILLGRLRQHGKRGWVELTFTPGSPDHWTSTRFIRNCTVEKRVRLPSPHGPVTVKYFASPDGEVSFFRASLKENTFLEKAFYEGLLRDYAASPMRIRRELEGECVYMEGAEWMPEYFDNLWFDEWPELDRTSVKVLSLDPSVGKNRNAGDYSAYVKLLWHHGLMYLDADMRTGQDSSMIAQAGVQLYSDWHPHFFSVEQEMGMHLLIAEMLRIADSRNMPMGINPVDSEHISKEIRIRELTPYVSKRQFRFKNNSPGAKLLFEQMMAFPLSQFDDGPDSLAYGVKTLLYAQTGRIAAPRTISYTAA